MVQKVKDRVIGGLIGTASGIIVGLVLFFFGGVRTEAKAFETLVDDKLDKIEYESDQTRRWKDHNTIHNMQYQIIKETNDKVDWLYKNEIEKKR